MDEDYCQMANRVIIDPCYRIERICRDSPLDNKEVDEQSMNDRRIVEGLFTFYKNKGDIPYIALRKAKATTIRLILNEVLS